MKNLNTGHIYKRDLFKIETDKGIGNGWPVAFSAGCSTENGLNYSVEVTGCHGDEIPSRVIDAKDTAELMAQLLNFYFRGYLHVGSPDQIALFEDKP